MIYEIIIVLLIVNFFMFAVAQGKAEEAKKEIETQRLYREYEMDRLEQKLGLFRGKGDGCMWGSDWRYLTIDEIKNDCNLNEND